ncbi:MAG: hypothetical protein ACK5MY_02550 [Jhaorihella sp.]
MADLRYPPLLDGFDTEEVATGLVMDPLASNESRVAAADILREDAGLGFGESDPFIDGAPVTEAAGLLSDNEQIADNAPVAQPDAVWGQTEPAAFEPQGLDLFDSEAGRYNLPAEDALEALPYGDYDPNDIRVQWLRGVGQYDGNFYKRVFNSRSSVVGGKVQEPTPQEVATEARQSAEALYQQLTGLSGSKASKTDLERLENEFIRMYTEQRDIMRERGELYTPPSDEDPSAEAFEARLSTATEQVGISGMSTYDDYLRQVTVRGKVKEDMTPEQIDAVVTDAILADLKDTDLTELELTRLRKRLDRGEWGDWRMPEVDPDSSPLDTMAPEEVETPGLFARIFGADTPEPETPFTEAPTQPQTPEEDTSSSLPETEATDPLVDPTATRPATPPDNTPQARPSFEADPEAIAAEITARAASDDPAEREAGWTTEAYQSWLQLQQIAPGVAIAYGAKQRELADQVLASRGESLAAAEELISLKAEEADLVSRSAAAREARDWDAWRDLQEDLRSNEIHRLELSLRYGADPVSTYENMAARAPALYENYYDIMVNNLPDLLRLDAEIQSLPQTEAMQRWNEAEDTWGALETLRENPIGTIRGLALTSGGVTAATMLATIAGSVAGPGGAAAAGGVVGGSAEFGLTVANEILDDMRANKVDTDDPIAVADYIENNREAMREAINKGVVRSLAVAGADAASGGAIGRVSQAMRGAGASRLRNIAATTATAVGLEPGSEAAGEALAIGLTEGFNNIDGREVLAEALGGVGPSAVQGAGQATVETFRGPRAPTQPPPASEEPAPETPAPDLPPDLERAPDQLETPPETPDTPPETPEAEPEEISSAEIDAILGAPAEASAPVDNSMQRLSEDLAERNARLDIDEALTPEPPQERAAVQMHDASQRVEAPTAQEVETAEVLQAGIQQAEAEADAGSRQLSDNDRYVMEGLSEAIGVVLYRGRENREASQLRLEETYAEIADEILFVSVANYSLSTATPFQDAGFAIGVSDNPLSTPTLTGVPSQDVAALEQAQADLSTYMSAMDTVLASANMEAASALVGGMVSSPETASAMDLALLFEADNDQLLRWANATDAQQVADFAPDASLQDARNAAQLIWAARRTKARLDNAAREVSYALDAARARAEAVEGVRRPAQLAADLAAAETEQDVVAALERNAPDLVAEGGGGFRQLASRMRDAYLRMARGTYQDGEYMDDDDVLDPHVGMALDTAYDMDMLAASRNAEEWRTRRATANIAEEGPDAPSIDDVVAPVGSPTVTPDDVYEDAVVAASEQVSLRARTIQARNDIASGAASPERMAIARSSFMTDDEIGEMLVNEYGLSIDEAGEVIAEARNTAAAVADDPQAMADLQSRVDTRTERASQPYVPLVNPGVADDGSNVVGYNPDLVLDYDAELGSLTRFLRGSASADGVMTLTPDTLTPAVQMIRKVYKYIGMKRPVIVLPLGISQDPAAAQALLDTMPPGPRKDAMTEALRAETPAGAEASSIDTAEVDVIFVNEDLSEGRMAAIAMHEAGHLAMVQVLTSISAKTREMLNRAYLASPWATRMREIYGERGFFPLQPSEHAGDVDSVLPEEYQAYVNSFREWFASQVGQYFADGQHLKNTRPQGLVARLVQQVAKIWDFIRQQFLPNTRRQQTNIAVASAIEETVLAAPRYAPMPVFMEDFTPDSPYDALRVPQRRDPNQGELFDTEATPARAARRQPGGALQEVQDAVSQAVAERLDEAGVTLVFMTDTENNTARNARTVGDRGVGYQSMVNSRNRPRIVINTRKLTTEAQMLRAIDEQLVAQHGLRGALGSVDYATFRGMLYNPEKSSIKMTRGARRELVALRKKATKSLRNQGINAPRPNDVTDVMIGELAAQAANGDNSDALAAAGAVAVAGLRRGNTAPITPINIRAVLARAGKQSLYAVRGVKDPWVTHVMKTGQRVAADVIDNDRRPVPPSWFEENWRKKMWRVMTSRTAPFEYLKAYGRSLDGPLGEQLADQAQHLVDRIENFTSHRDAVRQRQFEAYDTESMLTALSKFASKIGARSQVSLHATLNIAMSARASIELNRNHALLYGDLGSPELEAQRAALVADADDQITALQGDGGRRDNDSFGAVKQVGVNLIKQLQGLVRDTDSPVDQYVNMKTDKYGKLLQDGQSAPWQSFSGVRTEDAMAVLDALNDEHGTNVLAALRDSGMDGRMRLLLDQTFRNRVASGVFGTTGERIMARLGLQHYTPLQGLDVSQGQLIREDPTGQRPPVNDDIAYITGARSANSRLITVDPRSGRQTMAVNDVMTTALREYERSLEEGLTSFLNGGLVKLDAIVRQAGIGPVGGDPDSLPISIDTVPAYVWVDAVSGNEVKGEVTEEMIRSGAVRHVRNKRATETMTSVYESGKTGSILHTMPNGDVMVISVNDPILYGAMTGRYVPGSSNATANWIQRRFGAITRFRGHLNTSLSPEYTTFKAVMRDMQENAAIMFFEHDVPASKIAGLPLRATALLPRLEQFFWSSPRGQRDIINAALADESHPLHKFAMRWDLGGVQRFSQQLELTTDPRTLRATDPELALEDDPTPSMASDLLSGAAGGVRVAVSKLEAHADATENAIRQAAAEILEEEFLARGADPVKARDDAYRTANSAMNYGVKSELGEALAPYVPFAQVSLTGLKVYFENRIWRGGQPPANIFNNEVVNGKLVQTINWGAAVRAMDKRQASLFFALGLTNVLLTAGAVGSGMSWLLDDADDLDDDEIENPDALVAAKNFDRKVTERSGELPDEESMTWLRKALDLTNKELFGSNAGASDLSYLNPRAVMGSWILPWSSDDQQGAAPVAYGVAMTFADAGKALGLYLLGHDARDVAGAYVNAQIQNLTPLSAEYSSEVDGPIRTLAATVLDTANFLYSATQGEQLIGDQRVSMGFEGFGFAVPEGIATVPTMTQSASLQSAMLSADNFIEGLGFMAEDIGVPGAAFLARQVGGLIPDGRYVEWAMGEAGSLGAWSRDMVRGLEQEQSRDAYANRDDGNLGLDDLTNTLGSTIIRKSGLAVSGPSYDAVSDLYKEANDPAWMRIATWANKMKNGDVRYRDEDEKRIMDAVSRYNSLAALSSKTIGALKRDRFSAQRKLERAESQEERTLQREEMARLDVLENAHARTVERALRHMRDTLDLNSPRYAD